MRRDILRRPRSVKIMVGGGVVAALVAFVVCVAAGVPWWHSPAAAYALNGITLAAALAGLALGAKVAVVTAPRPRRRWEVAHRAGR